MSIQEVAETLRNAQKGFATDEEPSIKIKANRKNQ